MYQLFIKKRERERRAKQTGIRNEEQGSHGNVPLLAHFVKWHIVPCLVLDLVGYELTQPGSFADGTRSDPIDADVIIGPPLQCQVSRRGIDRGLWKARTLAQIDPHQLSRQECLKTIIFRKRGYRLRGLSVVLSFLSLWGNWTRDCASIDASQHLLLRLDQILGVPLKSLLINTFFLMKFFPEKA